MGDMADYLIEQGETSEALGEITWEPEGEGKQMSRYIDMFFKVSVPIKLYERWNNPHGFLSSNPTENIRDMIEWKLQSFNKNITVTKDKPTQER